MFACEREIYVVREYERKEETKKKNLQKMFRKIYTFRYCGNDLPPEYLSNSNRLYVRFRSDYSISHSGFKASYVTGTAVYFKTR